MISVEASVVESIVQIAIIEAIVLKLSQIVESIAILKLSFELAGMTSAIIVIVSELIAIAATIACGKLVAKLIAVLRIQIRVVVIDILIRVVAVVKLATVQILLVVQILLLIIRQVLRIHLHCHLIQCLLIVVPGLCL